MARTGRNPTLDEEMIKELCRAKESGLSNSASADYVRIDEVTLYRYINKGKEDIDNGKDTIYSKFYKEFKRSTAKFKAYHIDLIKKASQKGSWQGSAWLLERAYPKEFGRNIIITDGTETKAIDKLAKALEDLCNED